MARQASIYIILLATSCFKLQRNYYGFTLFPRELVSVARLQFYKIHTETQQLRNGLLETLQFNHLVRDSPDAIRYLLMVESFQILSAVKIQDMMTVQDT